MTSGNGVAQSRDYDNRGQLTDTEVNGLTASLASFAYGFDAVGQLTSTETTLDGQDVDRVFEYDPLSQLNSVATTVGATTTSEDYDATSGGLLTEIVGGRTLTYSTAQQLISADAIVGPDIAFAYDTAGRRTSSGPLAGTATTYGYDAAGYIATVATPSTTVGYTTDARGLRQTRTEGAVSDDFLWFTVGGLPLLLDDGDRSYIYGPSSTPIAQIDDTGTVEYLHTDLLGSVRLITDEDGDAVSTATFDEFGTRGNHTGTADSAFGYTGAWTDADTGLVHLRARDYDPATGQFLTVDPAVDQTRQPYAYTGNNPLTRTDPTGLEQCAYNDWICQNGGDKGHESNANVSIEMFEGFWRSDSGTNVSSLFAGTTDTLTISPIAMAFGHLSLTALIRDKLAPGWNCVYESNGFFMYGSLWSGGLTGGSGTAVVSLTKTATQARAAVAAVQASMKSLAASSPKSIVQAMRAGAPQAPVFRSDVSHIFRDARGHLADDTPANRALISSVVNPSNVVGQTVLDGGTTIITRYKKLLLDGTEAWAEVRNGAEITNGGLNRLPR